MHVSLDTETWGKKPGHDLRSIGAVVFDPVYGAIRGDALGRFYVATDNRIVLPDLGYWDGINAYRKYPLTRDPETVKWWSEQSEEAQAAFANPVDLRDALRSFGIWLLDVSGSITSTADNQEIRIWANDPHFDCSILAAAFDAVGLEVSWHYRSPRSMKTVCDLADMTRDDMTMPIVQHHALYDAVAQAQTISDGYMRLGLQRDD